MAEDSPSRLYPDLDDSSTDADILYTSTDYMNDVQPRRSLRKETEARKRRRSRSASNCDDDPVIQADDDAHLKNDPPLVDSGFCSLNVFLFFFVVIASLALLAYGFFPMYNKKKQDWAAESDRILTSIRRLKLDARFSNAHDELFPTLLAASRVVLHTDPPLQPSCILLQTKKGDRCLVQRLARIFNSTDSTFDGHTRWTSTLFRQRLEEALRKHLMVTVHRVDHLSSAAISTFFSFCDNSNAPFPRALIMLTVESDSGMINLEEHLRTTYSAQFNDDQFAALMTRVGNYMASDMAGPPGVKCEAS